MKFRITLKPNQQLKYLNRSNTHLLHVFRAVPNVITKHSTQLTSITLINENRTIDKLYPGHARGLQNAGLTPMEYTTLRKVQEEIREAKKFKATKIASPNNNQAEIKRKSRAARIKK